MKVLIACEESQTVCKAFRAKAQALSPFSNPRFNRYERHNKEREV